MPRIVIVGGGAGGLELATKLGKKLGRRGRAEIVLVDQSSTHVWKPLLHEVAAGALNSYQDELSYLAHARDHGFRFHYGRMDGLDRARKVVLLAPIHDEEGNEIVPRSAVPYDLLVLAVGSTTNDFGTPGVREHGLFLDSRVQAERFHRRLLALLLGVAAGGAPGPVRVAIIGGGATGVELAAELRSMAEQLSRYGFPVPASALQVTVIEAAERILVNLPEHLSASVTAALQQMEVTVLTGARVARLGPGQVELADGRAIEAQLKVWTAGIKAPEFLAGIGGLESTRNGQLVVRPTLQTTRDDDVFAFGDCASCPQPDGPPVPARAQAAHQQASFLVGALRQYLAGKPLPAYRYRDFGSLVSLSRSAVGVLMGGVFRKSHRIQGQLAKLAYMSLYRMHQMALHGALRTAILVLTNRLQRATQPPLKLH